MNWNIFTKTEQASHIMHDYFNASWEFWKRQIDNNLWDWAVDGPFCQDKNCAQRMRPCLHRHEKIWKCVRCGSASRIPPLDFIALRERVIQNFEEKTRTCVS